MKMNVVGIENREKSETELVLATDRLASVAQTPVSAERDAELRRLHAKLGELIAEVA